MPITILSYIHTAIICTTTNTWQKGTVKNGRDSPGQRLGVKKFGGEIVEPGNIIIRQRGQKYKSGKYIHTWIVINFMQYYYYFLGINTKMGRDHTIYSVSNGWV